MRILGLGLAVAVMAGGAAQAGMLPDGGVTAAEMAAALQAKGLAAEITTDSEGDPMIKSGVDGSSFRVLFYNCSKAKRCGEIAYMAAFDLDKGTSFGAMNTWNRKHRFGRAYLDDEMDPYLLMDVDFEHGATSEAVENSVRTWASILPVFKQHIDW